MLRLYQLIYRNNGKQSRVDFYRPPRQQRQDRSLLHLWRLSREFRQSPHQKLKTQLRSTQSHRLWPLRPRWIRSIHPSTQVTRRLTLPVLSIKGCSIPTAGLFSSVVAGVVGWDLFHFYGASRLASIKRDLVLNSKGVPLWSNLRNAVNPERAFFELADERHNEPLIFHSGLYKLFWCRTPETAAKMIPDKVIGSAPQKPHAPSAHHWSNQFNEKKLKK